MRARPESNGFKDLLDAGLRRYDRFKVNETAAILIVSSPSGGGMATPANTNRVGGMIKTQMREEILYREALAMGLDKDDSVVCRRT